MNQRKVRMFLGLCMAVSATTALAAVPNTPAEEPRPDRDDARFECVFAKHQVKKGDGVVCRAFGQFDLRKLNHEPGREGDRDDFLKIFCGKDADDRRIRVCDDGIIVRKDRDGDDSRRRSDVDLECARGRDTRIHVEDLQIKDPDGFYRASLEIDGFGHEGGMDGGWNNGDGQDRDGRRMHGTCEFRRVHHDGNDTPAPMVP